MDLKKGPWCFIMNDKLEKVLLLGPEDRVLPIKRFLTSNDYELLTYNDKITADFVRQNNVSYIVSYGYAPIIKKDVIDVLPREIINIHGAYLPEGRGIYPNVWALLQSFPIGVTLHYIDEGIDTGEVIARKEVLVKDDDTLKTLHSRLLSEVEELFYKNWSKIVSREIEPTSQKTLSIENHYRNRKESIKLMSIFPKMWDTPVSEVKLLSEEFLQSEPRFWEKYLSQRG